MSGRVREWVKRYLPAEVISLLLTVVAISVTYSIRQNRLSTAIAGTWFGNVGYFGYLLIADIIYAHRVVTAAGLRYTRITFYKNARALFAEFGIAELLDSLLIRPALMYYLPIVLGDILIGSVIAKFVSDITFYLPAIISYERTKMKFRKFD